MSSAASLRRSSLNGAGSSSRSLVSQQQSRRASALQKALADRRLGVEQSAAPSSGTEQARPAVFPRSRAQPRQQSPPRVVRQPSGRRVSPIDGLRLRELSPQRGRSRSPRPTARSAAPAPRARSLWLADVQASLDFSGSSGSSNSPAADEGTSDGALHLAAAASHRRSGSSRKRQEVTIELAALPRQYLSEEDLGKMAVAEKASCGNDSDSAEMLPGVASSSPSCAICMQEFCAREEVMRLPCTHVFHAACAMEWLRRRPVCPLDLRPLTVPVASQASTLQR
eukprot:TRINITY_DN44653_c0_g1_i1.p1 TRINITY_DN44653_c0_g1~~TRINITY_DN44653_c0_g1_i1.p1  ORF type:complete len:282 (+),score=51.58 TRINITY_DN44653_c0_g1_i1:94-939(+)